MESGRKTFINCHRKILCPQDQSAFHSVHSNQFDPETTAFVVISILVFASTAWVTQLRLTQLLPLLRRLAHPPLTLPLPSSRPPTRPSLLTESTARKDESVTPENIIFLLCRAELDT